MEVKYTEASIIDALNLKYRVDRVQYRLSNAYIFKHNWETDFFVLQKTGYCYEIEIKVSRGDFLADLKKKDKHSILKNGSYEKTFRKFVGFEMDGSGKSRSVYEKEVINTIEHKFRPNKFFYCVPEGLVGKSEVPDYAGLMYVDQSGDIIEVKTAPFLHREKIEFHKTLCSKFYYYWLNSEREKKYFQREIDIMRGSANHSK